jgi:hypothetical protein
MYHSIPAHCLELFVTIVKCFNIFGTENINISGILESIVDKNKICVDIKSNYVPSSKHPNASRIDIIAPRTITNFMFSNYLPSFQQAAVTFLLRSLSHPKILVRREAASCLASIVRGLLVPSVSPPSVVSSASSISESSSNTTFSFFSQSQSLSEVITYCKELSKAGEDLIISHRLAISQARKAGVKPPTLKLPEALLAQRHGGILGLAAIVDVFPFDLPPFLPAILERIVTFCKWGEVEIVSSKAKEILTEV